MTTTESPSPFLVGQGLTDPEIAGIMGWRGPGAYTATTLRKIRQVIGAALKAQDGLVMPPQVDRASASPAEPALRDDETASGVCISPLATRPILYTDTVNGQQTCRDDLWAVTTAELNSTAARNQVPAIDKENAVQQAQIWAMEAKTQRATVISILKALGLPEQDYNALPLVLEAINAIKAQNLATSGHDATGAALDEDEQIALMLKIEDYMGMCDYYRIQTHPQCNAAEAAIYALVDGLLAKRATAPSEADKLDAAPEGMPVEQEPKYGIRENRLYNRASGEIIPADEPVFIFRARDHYALPTLAFYMTRLTLDEHRVAVGNRVQDFDAFSQAHPERMKEPDTATIAAEGRAALASPVSTGIADPYPTVPVPQDSDMAQLMLNMGLMWLQGNAPERLTEIGRAAVPAQPTQPQPDPFGDKWHSLTCDGTCSPPCAAAQPQQVEGAAPTLTVWEGAMPESNGKSNFTAILTRKDAEGFDIFDGGFTIARSEYPDRVRYEADCVRHIIGELAERPDILAYDADKHSGYVKPSTLSPEPAKVGGAGAMANGFDSMEREDWSKLAELRTLLGIETEYPYTVFQFAIARINRLAAKASGVHWRPPD